MLAASHGSGDVKEVIYWILLILSFIGLFPFSWPYANQGRMVIVLIMLAIIGLVLFGNPS